MQHLLNDVRESLEQDRWYGALGIALALPDICAKLERQTGGNGDKYRRWFDANIGEQHTHLLQDQTSVQMRGDDAWQLRCAYLHSGDVDIAPDTSGARSHHRFRFIHLYPKFGGIPRQVVDDELMVEVDEFCEDMCVMVERWMTNVDGDSAIQERIAAMPMVFEVRPGVEDHGRWDVGLARIWHPESLKR